MREVLALEGDWTIDVDNPAIVSKQLDRIKAYLECLRSVGFEGAEADRFICPIEIASGFVAPLHLLTGLLIEFNEKWRPILETFDRDANSGTGGPLLAGLGAWALSCGAFMRFPGCRSDGFGD